MYIKRVSQANGPKVKKNRNFINLDALIKEVNVFPVYCVIVMHL